MGAKTCSVYHGLGDTITYETVPNNAPGGSLYTTVQKRRLCAKLIDQTFLLVENYMHLNSNL